MIRTLPHADGPSAFPLAWRDPTLRLVLLVALVVRTGVALTALERGTTESADTHTYVRPAESLVAVGRFDSDRAPELSRTPGYPVLLAVGELTRRVVPTTVALQVILNTATTLGVALLALAMGSTRRVAVLAAAIYALEPSGIVYVSKLLTETLFTAAVTAILVTFTLWVRDGGRTQLFGAAALVAVAGFVRPIAYYAPLPLAALAMFVAWRYHHLAVRAALLSAVAFFVTAGAPLAAWRVRNTMVAGYDRFAAIGDVNLLYYRAAGVVARRSGQSIDAVQARMRRELDADAPLIATDRRERGHERTARYLEMRRRAGAILISDPAAVALDAVAGAARTVFGRETSEWGLLLGLPPLSRGWLAVRVMLTLAWLPVLFVAVVGLLAVRWDLRVVLPGILLSAYLVVLSAGPEAYSRFRLAFVPVVSIFAAAGATYVRQRVAALRDRPHHLATG